MYIQYLYNFMNITFYIILCVSGFYLQIKKSTWTMHRLLPELNRICELL